MRGRGDGVELRVGFSLEFEVRSRWGGAGGSPVVHSTPGCSTCGSGGGIHELRTTAAALPVHDFARAISRIHLEDQLHRRRGG